MNFEDAYHELKEIREKGGRESERVIELWNACVRDLSYKLGDEIWVIYEQVFIAALDTDDKNVAMECFHSLETKFKNSSRVKRLYAMLLEYQENFEDAKRMYDNLLKEDPTNVLINKRLIAVLKAQGKSIEAIRELNKYLEKFMSDYEAWGELCNMYLSECDYRRAAFCMEELILSNPHNHLYHQIYAEIKYTEGGIENLEIARSYFAEACKLNEKNMRALLGLRLTSLNLAQNNKVSKELKKECQKSVVWASAAIAKLYESVAPDLDSVSDVESELTNQMNLLVLASGNSD